MKKRIGTVDLYVEEKGNGSPALVFLHYWGGTHRTWNEVIEAFSEVRHTVTFDALGWGLSGPAENGYSIGEMAATATVLIEQLHLESYVLIGHSMGGKVSQLLASRQPQGLVGLVLVAPASPAPTRFPEEAMQQQIHAYDNQEKVVQTIAFLTARPPLPAITDRIIEDSLSGTPEAKLAWPTASILEDFSSEVTKIRVPTLVIAGEDDRLDSIEQHRHEIVERVPNAQFTIISGTGHLIPVDAPKVLAEVIELFLSRLRT